LRVRRAVRDDEPRRKRGDAPCHVFDCRSTFARALLGVPASAQRAISAQKQGRVSN
jgi:hypothetical protein